MDTNTSYAEAAASSINEDTASTSTSYAAVASGKTEYPKMKAAKASSSSKFSKRTVHKGGKTNSKKIKFHSASCGDAAQQESAYHKLDHTVEQQARKMQQRRKAIDKGKNTIGYELYCQQVPKRGRRKRSMDTPSTPDHTLDIPNKKWAGMVRAWRIALHKYDPKDLQESFAELQEHTASEKAMASPKPAGEPKTVKEQELEKAKSSGLLDFVKLSGDLKRSNTISSPPPRLSQSDTSMDVDDMLSPVVTHNNVMSELDQWESARDNDDNEVISVIDSVGEESDDDLL